MSLSIKAFGTLVIILLPFIGFQWNLIIIWIIATVKRNPVEVVELCEEIWMECNIVVMAH